MASLPPFNPEIKTLTVRVRRVVPLAPYSSFELTEESEFVPDPTLSTAQNLSRMRDNLIRHVDQACDAIEKTITEDE